MKINSINRIYYQPKVKQSKSISLAENRSFRGTKGFITGAIAGGLMASLFTDLFLVSAAVGGIIGDWIENLKNKDNNNNSTNRT